MADIKNKFDEVEIPASLTERQVKIARALVENELNENLPQVEFTRKHNMSTATLAKWKNKNVDFQHYMDALKGDVISGDEIRAFNVIKRDMLKKINSGNYTDAERDFYMKHFDHVVRYENKQAMQALGIDTETGTGGTVNIEERKNVLLKKLKG